MVFPLPKKQDHHLFIHTPFPKIYIFTHARVHARAHTHTHECKKKIYQVADAEIIYFQHLPRGGAADPQTTSGPAFSIPLVLCLSVIRAAGRPTVYPFPVFRIGFSAFFFPGNFTLVINVM